MSNADFKCFFVFCWMWAENKWGWEQSRISPTKKKKEKKKVWIMMFISETHQGFFSLFGGSLIFIFHSTHHPPVIMTWAQKHIDFSFEHLPRHIVFWDLRNCRRYHWPVLSTGWALIFTWNHLQKLLSVQY